MYHFPTIIFPPSQLQLPYLMFRLPYTYCTDNYCSPSDYLSLHCTCYAPTCYIYHNVLSYNLHLSNRPHTETYHTLSFPYQSQLYISLLWSCQYLLSVPSLQNPSSITLTWPLVRPQILQSRLDHLHIATLHI